MKNKTLAMKNKLLSFTPDARTFRPEWLKIWSRGNCEFRSFRITTSILDGTPVRTFGVYGVPKGKNGPFPGLLHIHGGGQTFCEGNIAHHVKRGYAVISFDWTGNFAKDRETELVTSYPDSVRCAAFDLNRIEDLEYSRYYLAAKAARCCLKFLSTMKEVDKKNIGVYGLSWGGFLTWLVNGTDKTAKCAIPIYGTGACYREGHCMNSQGYCFNSAWTMASDGGRKVWASQMEPQNFIQTQNSPVLFVNGANDFFGGFDVSAEMLPRLLQDWRCDFTPNSNHHFDSGSERLIEAWFDHYLKGAPELASPPEIHAKKLKNNILELKTKGNPNNITLYYSVGNAQHENRCWHESQDWKKDDCGFISMKIKVPGNTWLYLREKHSKPSYTLSSMPLCIDFPEIPVKTNPVLFDGKIMKSGWGIRFDPEICKTGTGWKHLAFEKSGALRIATNKNGDFAQVVFFGMANPGSNPSPHNLAIEINVSGLEFLTIEAHPTDHGLADPCICELDKVANGKNSISASQFVSAKGKKMKNFLGIGYFAFSGRKRPGKEIIIKKIKWAE